MDIETYLSNDDEFRSSIYDRREIQYIADRFGLPPECISSELKRLGYQRINNGHGRMIWKSKEAERINYNKKIADLEDYISRCEKRQQQFYDKSELGRIVKRICVSRDDVRAALRRRGYKLTVKANGISVGAKKAMRQNL